MSQSWDNVANMHDHLQPYVLANSILPVQDWPLVQYICADGSRTNFEPIIAITIDRYDKEQLEYRMFLSSFVV